MTDTSQLGLPPDDLSVSRAETQVCDLLAAEPGATPQTTVGRRGRTREAAREAMRNLPKRSAKELLEDRGVLIGEGGMGVVRAARQRSVGRNVAVKALRQEQRTEALEAGLLQEAWLTAALDHPNIVPVHDVVLDPVEGPLIVLKHVSGTEWSTVIRDEAIVREQYHGDDLLEFNLDVLMQLCRAIHFAHDKHILHRDIKPANVMIGSFGEVYLLDWGIAVSLEPDPTGRFPRVALQYAPAGTLAYMAPEMLDKNAHRIGTHTDVYLLGAVLYEIAVGKAPHDRGDTRATAFSILESRPHFPANVPDELQRIISKAMNVEPLGRHRSAEALRRDIASFLRNRDSMRLVDEALVRFGDLTWMLETHDRESVDKNRLFELFGQCQFGLRQALVGWDGNERARAALCKLLDRMALYLLRSGDPGAAQALFAEHPSPDAELVLRVSRAVEAKKLESGELARLQQDLDPTIGAGARRWALLAMGALWTVAPLLANVVDPATTPKIMNYVSPVVLLVLALIVWWVARDKLSKTAINRRFLVAMLVGFCAHMVHLLVVPMAGLPPKTELAAGMVTFGAILGVLAHTAEKRLWPLVPVYWLGALVGAMWLPRAAYALSACNFLLTIYMFSIWKTSAVAERETST